MKITKEYLKQIIKEELEQIEESGLSNAARNIIDQDTASRYGTDKNNKNLGNVQDFEKNALAISSTPGTSQNDISAIIKRYPKETQNLIIRQLGQNPTMQQIQDFLLNRTER